VSTRLGEVWYVLTFLTAGAVAAVLIAIARRLSR
jgi:hypothetical protein